MWAPNVTNLAVRILREGEQPRTIPMTGSADGEFVATVSDVSEGADYFYVLDGERERPDPVSRWLPRRRTRSDSHRESRVVSLVGSSVGQGIPLKDFIIYELHPGTFTTRGHLRKRNCPSTLSSRSRHHRD